MIQRKSLSARVAASVLGGLVLVAVGAHAGDGWEETYRGADGGETREGACQRALAAARSSAFQACVGRGGHRVGDFAVCNCAPVSRAMACTASLKYYCAR